MNRVKFVVTERRSGGPDAAALRRVVAAWLAKELSKP